MEKAEFASYLSTFTDADACMQAFKDQARFIRLNTLKISQDRFDRISALGRTSVGYCPDAFKLEEGSGFDIGRSWEYFLGYIYPQSLPSMLVSHILGPGEDELVLDAAASPGSKFSHMAMLMRNRGVLVGNDAKKEKISALYSTINRMNILNCIITIRDAATLDWQERFDKVLLDAPCTALGSAEAAIGRWGLENSKRISAIQKKMLFSTYDALKPGGTLVYSTCTYAKEENEDVVQNLLDNVPEARLVPIYLEAPHDKGIADGREDLSLCWRIYPHHMKSEGFFIAKIRKGV